jgi:hypothetical protein
MTEQTKTSAVALPISRKLAGGTGLGAAATVLGVSALTHITGYVPTADEIVAAQTVISFGIGWYVREHAA